MTESKTDGLDAKGYRQFAHALPNTYFSMVVTSEGVKVEEDHNWRMVDVCRCT